MGKLYNNIKLLTLFFLLFALLLAGCGEGMEEIINSQGTGGASYKEITIDGHTLGLSSNVSNFPLLINLNLTNFPEIATSTEPGGADIRFRKPDNTLLPYEIEAWSDGTSGTVWVLLDTISSSSQTTIRMYYNDPGASSMSDANSVFNNGNGFQGVYHLDDDPGGGAGSITDSTGNGNHGSPVNGLDSSDSVIIGIIDGSVKFDDGEVAGAEYIEIPADASLQFTGDMTISAWVKLGAGNSGDYLGIGGNLGSVTGNYFGYCLRRYTDGHINFMIGNSTATVQSVESIALHTDTNYKHVAGVLRSGTMYLYINGVEQADTLGSITPGANPLTKNPTIGRMYTDFDQRGWLGELDEMRFENAARSADWIKLSYETQKSGSTVVNILP